jgi:LmbE family N-acetylglucosaminyl deacetylase
MFRLMVVTAHPDDEAGNFGGTLRHYHEYGAATSVICLTPGQAATNRGGARNDQELAAMRRKEFASACELLKVSQGVVLDYPDGKLHCLDAYRVVNELTLHIRQFRPQVVATFGPEGGLTAHTDHSLAGIFATLAFHWAGRSNRYPDQLKENLAPYSPQKLYYSTANTTLSGRPPIIHAPITAAVDVAPQLEAKLAAFKAHTSQNPLFPILEEHVRKHGKHEYYHLVASARPAPHAPETDLFEGVEGDL